MVCWLESAVPKIQGHELEWSPYFVRVKMISRRDLELAMEILGSSPRSNRAVVGSSHSSLLAEDRPTGCGCQSYSWSAEQGKRVFPSAPVPVPRQPAHSRHPGCIWFLTHGFISFPLPRWCPSMCTVNRHHGGVNEQYWKGKKLSSRHLILVRAGVGRQAIKYVLSIAENTINSLRDNYLAFVIKGKNGFRF